MGLRFEATEKGWVARPDGAEFVLAEVTWKRSRPQGWRIRITDERNGRMLFRDEFRHLGPMPTLPAPVENWPNVRAKVTDAMMGALVAKGLPVADPDVWENILAGKPELLALAKERLSMK